MAESELFSRIVRSLVQFFNLILVQFVGAIPLDLALSEVEYWFVGVRKEDMVLIQLSMTRCVLIGVSDDGQKFLQ